LGYVSHVNSPTDFFVQIAHESEQMDWVTQTLQEIYLEPLTSDQIERGVRCIAKYPLDGCFYRAEILSVMDDGQIFVKFMDFGNISPVVDLRELPECMYYPSRLANACKLHLPAGKVWANGAAELLSEMAQEGHTEFEVEVLKEGERWRVNLRMGGKNVIDNLVVTDEPRRALQLKPVLEKTKDETDYEELYRALQLEPVLKETEHESEDEKADNDGAASASVERAFNEDAQSICEDDADVAGKAIEVSSRNEGYEVPVRDGRVKSLTLLNKLMNYFFHQNQLIYRVPPKSRLCASTL
jgi:Tudor domain